MSFEPDVLRLGKAFGVEVQADYPPNVADVHARAEHRLERGSGRATWDKDGTRSEPLGARLGRRGRIDLLLEGLDEESGLPFQVVLEIKRTDWDRQAEHRVAPNVARHRLQVWSYLEPLLERVDNREVAWVQGALVYPRRPQTAGRASDIEQRLGEYGLTVLWYDELPPA
jgi:hypothetical protein